MGRERMNRVEENDAEELEFGENGSLQQKSGTFLKEKSRFWIWPLNYGSLGGTPHKTFSLTFQLFAEPH